MSVSIIFSIFYSEQTVVISGAFFLLLFSVPLFKNANISENGQHIIIWIRHLLHKPTTGHFLLDIPGSRALVWGRKLGLWDIIYVSGNLCILMHFDVNNWQQKMGTIGVVWLVTLYDLYLRCERHIAFGKKQNPALATLNGNGFCILFLCYVIIFKFNNNTAHAFFKLYIFA